MAKTLVSQGNLATTALRAAAAVTDSYVASSAWLIEGANHLELLIAMTKASVTSFEFKLEFSDDNSNWYQETAESTSGGTVTVSLAEYTIVASGLGETANAVIPLDRIAHKFMRVSTKGTGTVTSTSVAITGVKSNI